MNTKKKKSCPYVDYYKSMTQRQMYNEGEMTPMPYMVPHMMEEMAHGDVSSEEMVLMPDTMLPVLPEDFEYARAYVPIQYYTNAYSPQEALMRGTLFPELYQPYYFTRPIAK